MKLTRYLMIAAIGSLTLLVAGCQTSVFRDVATFMNLTVTDASGTRPLVAEDAESDRGAPEEGEALPEVEVPIVQLSAGRAVTFAVDENGGLWRWGANDSDLGLPFGHRERRPSRVFPEIPWAQVAVGTRHVLLISEAGALYSWGVNDNSVLGLGPDYENNPFPAGGPHLVDDTQRWAQVSAGDQSSYALEARGNLFAWGSPANGRLGVGAVDQARPISFPQQVGGTWATVSAGDRFALAITPRGLLYSWGANDEGQLGIGADTDELAPAVVTNDTDWTHVSAGAGYALALRGGRIYAWGNNDAGQLGLGEPSQPVRVATRVGTRSDWISIDAGAGYQGPTQSSTYTPASGAIDGAGTLYLWGSNRSALLGTGEQELALETVAEPRAVEGASGGSWHAVSIGGEHAAGIRGNGGVYTWGSDAQSRSGGRPTGAVQVVPIGLLPLLESR